MGFRSFFGPLAISLCWLHSAAAQPAPLRVLASNGMKAVVVELAPQLEKAAGRYVSFEFGSTTGLRQKIDGGVAFDVAILTSGAIGELVRQNRLNATTRTDFARSGIGVAVKSGTPKPDVSTPAAMKRMLDRAKTITYAGDGASRPAIDSMIAKLGLASEMKPRTILTTGSGAAMTSVADGKVDVVMTLMSELLPVHGIDIAGPFPPELQGYVTFGAAANLKAAQPESAKAMIAFLRSAAAGPVYKAKGMELVRP
jgi:molybdate transport system substrate-binding protein